MNGKQLRDYVVERGGELVEGKRHIQVRYKGRLVGVLGRGADVSKRATLNVKRQLDRVINDNR